MTSLPIVISLLILCILLLLIISKLSSETYCVDISGGFKQLCSCHGGCAMKK